MLGISASSFVLNRMLAGANLSVPVNAMSTSFRDETLQSSRWGQKMIFCGNCLHQTMMSFKQMRCMQSRMSTHGCADRQAQFVKVASHILLHAFQSTLRRGFRTHQKISMLLPRGFLQKTSSLICFWVLCTVR